MAKFNFKEYFMDISLRSKFLLGYVTLFVCFISLSYLVFYPIIRNNIEANNESNLNISTQAILSAVKTVADASIKNYLRAVAEKNRDIVIDSYEMYRQGKLSEQDAKKRAKKLYSAST